MSPDYNVPLVSVLTPCFNGERFLQRYFSCLLEQTYPNVEIVFVDDGSIDHTRSIVESHRKYLESKGYVFKYIRKERGGTASAINVGLKSITGRYLTWPDVDDLMAPDCLLQKVCYLETHPDAGLVCCAVNYVHESNIEEVVEVKRFDETVGGNIFDALIHEEGVFCTPVAYMIRTTILDETVKGRCIYESPSGQNWQLLFPMTYAYNCGWINRPLVTYVIHGDSHSHSIVSLKDRLQRTYELEDIIRHTLPTIPMTEADRIKYNAYVDVKYLMQRFSLALALNNYILAKDCNVRLEDEYGQSIVRQIMLTLCKFGGGRLCYTLIQLVWSTKKTVKQLLHC